MKNKVKLLREERNWTQNELAEKSRLSLRTIQRIEAGNILKGFTLKTIAETFETETQNLLVDQKESTEIERIKLINLSALSGFIIPFGSIIFPLILTYKTKDFKTKEMGKQIVSVQIILTLIVSLTMIICPFIQKAFAVKFPLFIVPLITFLFLKLLVIILNGISLNTEQELRIKLKNNFL